MSSSLHFSRISGALAALLAIAGLGAALAATSFAPDESPVGYMAALEVSNPDLTQGAAIAFKTDYDRNVWTGNVLAYPVGPDGVIRRGEELWGGARTLLDSQDFDLGRIIVTRDGENGVPFRYERLSAAQQDLLGTSPVDQRRILDFIRGDRRAESPLGALRHRDAVLGDILHSRPFYLGHPDGPVLFVGANDGMLHAFDARGVEGGGELWAYVPSMVFPNLKSLATNPYQHVYFVDGGLNVGGGLINGTQRKILVSGLGAGGRGLFALDVTNPHPQGENEAAARSLWEITNTAVNGAASSAYSDLGYTYGTPVIAKVNNGVHAAIVGNGYNVGASSSLYVIDLVTGALIRRISTGGPAGGGLSSPSCYDATGDSLVDYCYAGDIDGKLWKFNLTARSPQSWSASLLYSTAPAQAITMAPSIAPHPEGGVMVNFGTGRLFSETDRLSTATHYVYGIWDGAPAGNTVLLVQDLQERDWQGTAGDFRVRTMVDARVPDWSRHLGWRATLPQPGERVLGDSVFADNGRFYVSTHNPTVLNDDPLPDGENWLIEFDYLTGGVGSKPFLDLSQDQVLNAADLWRDPNSGATEVPLGKFLHFGIGSQPLLLQLRALNTTAFNENPDTLLPQQTHDRGVSGGHFDVDVYYPQTSTSKRGGTVTTFESRRHLHEYDDLFDVTGVNMLASSDAGLNINRAITNTSLEFKVLLQNQYLNPAVQVSVGGATYLPAKLYAGQAKHTLAADLLHATPTYSRNTVRSLSFNMPLDAFLVKDWWSAAGGSGYAPGDRRVGLQPSQTGCVKREASGATQLFFQPVVPPANGTDGPGVNATDAGVRHNGAFVVQLIRATTPSYALELQIPSHPEFGWRVKPAYFKDYVLAEWTVFWHHPNGLCYGSAGWTKLAPQDLDNAAGTPGTPAAGAADPAFGSFRGTSAVVNVIETVNSLVRTRITEYANGDRVTETRTRTGDGLVRIVTVIELAGGGGSTQTILVADPEGSTTQGADEARSRSFFGRLSWTELLTE